MFHSIWNAKCDENIITQRSHATIIPLNSPVGQTTAQFKNKKINAPWFMIVPVKLFVIPLCEPVSNVQKFLERSMWQTNL